MLKSFWSELVLHLLPQKWLAIMRRAFYRELLALLIWRCLPEATRQADDNKSLRDLAALVRWAETGVPPERKDGIEQLIESTKTANESEAIIVLATQLHDLAQRLIGRKQNSTVPILPWRLLDSSVAIKVSLWSLFNQAQVLRKQMASEKLADLQWSLSHMHGIIPLISAAFLFTGWLSNVLILTPFGIQTSRYFTLTDYLAASMDSVVSLLLSVGFPALIMYFTAGKMRLAILHDLLQVRRWSMLYLGAGAAGCLIVALKARNTNTEDAVMYALIGGIFLLIGLARYYSLRFARPTTAQFVITFVGTYGLVIGFNAYTRHIRYIDPQSEVSFQEVSVAGVNNDEPMPYRILAGNSNYLFLLDKHLQVFVVPIQNVKTIKIAKAVTTEPAI